MKGNITISELINQLAPLIAKELEPIIVKTIRENMNTFKEEPETPINIKELSKLINKTVPTIYGYCQRNEIPYSKKGNRLYFLKSQVMEWIMKGQQNTLSELEQQAKAFVKNRK